MMDYQSILQSITAMIKDLIDGNDFGHGTITGWAGGSASVA